MTKWLDRKIYLPVRLTDEEKKRLREAMYEVLRMLDFSHHFAYSLLYSSPVYVQCYKKLLKRGSIDSVPINIRKKQLYNLYRLTIDFCEQNGLTAIKPLVLLLILAIAQLYRKGESQIADKIIGALIPKEISIFQ